MTLHQPSKSLILNLVVAAALAIGPAALANAKKPDRNSDEPDRQPVRTAVEDYVADRTFTDDERSTIRDYFRKNRDGERTILNEEEEEEDDDDGKGKKKSKSGKSGKGKSKSMPQGLAKRDELPPGLAKQLEKNGTLPPGLAKRDLPNDLDSRLPKRRAGERRYIVDDQVILLDEKTGIVLDIIENVL